MEPNRMMPQLPQPPVQLFNGHFNPVTSTECIDMLFADLHANQRGWLCTVNVAVLMMMRSNPALQQFVDRARWTVADGQPLIWASRWFGPPLPERVTGIDLIEQLCQRAQQERIGIYCLGASDAVIHQLGTQLRAQYPKLELHTGNGYFSEKEAPQRAQTIAQSGAKILLVGMGVPKQEQFIEKHWAQLGVNIAIGVGGSFDVLAGLRQRAPQWVQRVGMEWFYRLIQEPQRLWKRYLVTNIQFVLLLIRGLILKPYRRR
jgi:N-acetylglucosaminyldiphosphoundecaprenol N-acetyl-beta-D-mannosaminyltransferase